MGPLCAGDADMVAFVVVNNLICCQLLDLEGLPATKSAENTAMGEPPKWCRETNNNHYTHIYLV